MATHQPVYKIVNKKLQILSTLKRAVNRKRQYNNSSKIN